MGSRSRTKHGASAKARRTGKSALPNSSLSRNKTTRPSSAHKRRTAAAKRHGKPNTSGSRGRRGSRAWLLPLALLCLLALAAWMLYPTARLQYLEARERTRLEQELASLKERNQDLRAQVDRLKTPEGVEELARSDLSMVKEGENLYVVTGAKETTDSGPVVDVCEPTSDSLLVRLLDYVFGLEQ